MRIIVVIAGALFILAPAVAGQTLRATVSGIVSDESGAVVEGASLDLAVEGWVNLDDTTLDMTVLVAPLKTVDSIVRYLPLIRTWLAGSLVTIPVRVHGRLADPEVTPLPPSEVGTRLIGLMKRTLELPIQIIQPILP